MGGVCSVGLWVVEGGYLGVWLEGEGREFVAGLERDAPCRGSRERRGGEKGGWGWRR